MASALRIDEYAISAIKLRTGAENFHCDSRSSRTLPPRTFENSSRSIVHCRVREQLAIVVAVHPLRGVACRPLHPIPGWDRRESGTETWNFVITTVLRITIS